jgi:hypothetical protein
MSTGRYKINKSIVDKVTEVVIRAEKDICKVLYMETLECLSRNVAKPESKEKKKPS